MGRGGRRERGREGGGEGCPCGPFELAKSCRCQFAESQLTTSTNHQRVKTIFTPLIFKQFLKPSLPDFCTRIGGDPKHQDTIKHLDVFMP